MGDKFIPKDGGFLSMMVGDSDGTLSLCVEQTHTHTDESEALAYLKEEVDGGGGEWWLYRLVPVACVKRGPVRVTRFGATPQKAKSTAKRARAGARSTTTEGGQ